MDYILSKEASVKRKHWPKNTLAAGRRHTIGLQSDGTAVAVGDNNYGQCAVSGWRDMVAVGG
jgi:alpha-tubulin suppressor-like RCC1 family protein